MSIITLTTDFGCREPFVGIIKGVILGIARDVRLVDISHCISPQNILEGALVLAQAAPFFPSGTVHLAVVDPGVGTLRLPIAARIGSQYYVGPDNGLFTPILEDAEKNDVSSLFIHLTNPTYWLAHVSCTFHGRDIFAPVAAHLANGMELEKMGKVMSDPLRIRLPITEKTDEGWIAHIISIDGFGNLKTDLTVEYVPAKKKISFSICGHDIRGLVESYGSRERGELIALIDGDKHIELAVVNGNAAKDLKARVGDRVLVKEIP
jgi:S-adenosylmethionine hydrolase